MPNSNAPASLTPAYFDDVYRAKSDPWNFASSPYEAAKYAATLAALPRPRYANAFEPGCSIGVLTAQLAPRCDRLLATDVSDHALAQARERCSPFPHVRFERRLLPTEFPTDETFDLILLSEIGYYLAMPDLLRLRDLCLTRLAAAGHLLLVHWTPPVHDYPLTGDEVHSTFAAATGERLRPLANRREETYRLDLFERV